jgi:hypothetical protein
VPHGKSCRLKRSELAKVALTVDHFVLVHVEQFAERGEEETG